MLPTLWRVMMAASIVVVFASLITHSCSGVLDADNDYGQDDGRPLVPSPPVELEDLQKALAQAMGYAGDETGIDELRNSLGSVDKQMEQAPPQLLVGSFARTIGAVLHHEVERGAIHRAGHSELTVHAIGTSAAREGVGGGIKLLGSAVDPSLLAGGLHIVLVGPDWTWGHGQTMRVSPNIRISIYRGLYNAATVARLGGVPAAVICFNCDIYHCHWRPSLLYLVANQSPVYLTFFEEFEAIETQRLLTKNEDGNYDHSFRPQQLDVNKCDDTHGGMFSRNDKWNNPPPLPSELQQFVKGQLLTGDLEFLVNAGSNPFRLGVPGSTNGAVMHAKEQAELERLVQAKRLTKMAARMLRKQNSFCLAFVFRPPPSAAVSPPQEATSALAAAVLPADDDPTTHQHQHQHQH